MKLRRYELLPPSVANEIMGDCLLAPLIHKIGTWWYKKEIKVIETALMGQPNHIE